MSIDRMITLAIHTYEKAVVLKSTLENEGVSAVISNVNLSSPTISSGVRVRIYEKDLPLALRIVENPEIFSSNTGFQSTIPSILVPIDFSDYSYRACLMAFSLAKLHKAKISIIHSYMYAHTLDKIRQMGEQDFSIGELNEKIEKVASEEMTHFSSKLKEQIKIGVIPAIKFETTIVEGVPEDSIGDYSKALKPQLIIMGTRGAGKKEKELIGSVTGEVLDTCQFPVFAVPESANIFEITELKHILFFCNNEQEDIVALDTMYRLLPNISLNVTIANVPHKSVPIIDSFVSTENDLISYCKENYPRFNFNLRSISLDNIKSEFDHISTYQQIDLIVVPNKKKNVFSRFFNPSLAHKILLHADIPMMTIPV